ncbi:MAG TPA: alpha/beta hydrolase [Ilumatobacter sp.]|nr:alpha/beta hydrolase [Ilumatobacter sp.]
MNPDLLVELDRVQDLFSSMPRTSTIDARRAAYDALFAGFPVDTRVTITPQAGRSSGEWYTPVAADPDAVVVWMHGGAYVLGSLRSHRHLVAEVARCANVRAFALDYRLAPEHPFPAAVDDALAAYEQLLGDGIDPTRIVLAGDSAGATLALATTLGARDRGLPLPAGCWCISPWVDLEARGDSISTRAAVDPQIRKETILELASLYLAGEDPRHHFAAPIYGDLRRLPALLVQVGSYEILLDDAIRLARRAGESEVTVELEIWPYMRHVWHLYWPLVSAARRAIEHGARFVRQVVDLDEPGQASAVRAVEASPSGGGDA